MIDLDKLVPLPDPKLRFDVGINRLGERMDYTANDMRAIRLAAWNAALEIAASDCCGFHGYHTAVQAQICEDLAESIRAMRIEPQK